MTPPTECVAFDRYRFLSNSLAYTRWLNDGYESKEEDEILEEKDVLWGQLTDAQRDEIRKTPPITKILVDVDVCAEPGSAPRKWVDVPHCRSRVEDKT